MANRIHPTAIIGGNVELGDGNVIGPYTVIVGPTTIGDGNWIGPHVTLGTPPESRGHPHPAAWEPEPPSGHDTGADSAGAAAGTAAALAGVRIGNRNTLREYVSVHQGTVRTTVLGDDGYLLRGSHLGHDDVVGDGVTLAGGVMLGGHVEVWSHANLGLNAVVHQHCRIGPGAMVGMASAVRREVGAFTITVGSPARTTGVNVVGLSRRGCDDALIDAVAEWVKGTGSLPSGLPAELDTLLKSWSERPPLPA